MTAKINYKRMLDNFIELTKIDATSYKELPMQEYAEKKLKELGCKVSVDNAGKHFETTAKGNVTGFMAGKVKSAPFVLGAHLDTVKPCSGIKAIVKGNKVTSDGSTILGADDRAGLAIIFEVLASLKESGIAHPPVEVAFTLCEESGMFGAKHFDISKLKGREGILLDNDNNTDLTVNAPEAVTINIEINGVAAHAGVCPENGISSLEVAAKAISIMKLGRIDPLTVANIGIVSGGDATNVVMPSLVLQAEARSRAKGKLKKQVEHMKECFKKAEKAFTKKVDGKVIKPVISFKTEEKYPLLNIPKDSALIKHIVACGKKHGIAIKPSSSGGGFDANILFGKGLATPILGIGYRDVHTTKEWLDIAHFNKTADIVLDIVLNYKK